MKRLIFFNHFGAGDLFESREFIKDWMQRVPADEYLFAHGKRPDLLADIPNLGFTPVTERMDGMKAVTIDGDDMLVNTWIGRDGKYVLPGIGCVVEKLYEMHNDMLASQGLEPLDGTPVEYIPTINYGPHFTGAAADAIAFIGDKRTVLICNGPAQSCQAENFNLDMVIEKLCEAYPDTQFLITQPSEAKAYGNLYSVAHLGLNEISLLSRYSEVIVGRNSGPHVFSQVLPNWQTPTKTLVCFTYQRTGACFVANPEALGLRMKVVWSNTTNPDEAFNIIASL